MSIQPPKGSASDPSLTLSMVEFGQHLHASDELPRRSLSGSLVRRSSSDTSALKKPTTRAAGSRFLSGSASSKPPEPIATTLTRSRKSDVTRRPVP